MSTTYLEICNEVLSELNEVLLTTATFSAAVNIQRHVKEAVNRAYMDINNPEHKWPWLSAAAPVGERFGNVVQETVADQRWYLIKEGSAGIDSDYGHIDWESFELTTEGVAGETSPYTNKVLKYLDLDDWRDHFARKEAQAITGNEPYYIIKNPDGRRFGLSPIPDKVYKLYYYAWNRPTKLINYDDTVNLPDQYVHVLVSRARYYAWQRKEHAENSQIALQDYLKGLKGMRQQTIDQFPDSMMDSRIRFV